MCTSELASTYLPFWRWSRGKIYFKDEIWFQYPASIPFLSSFYPFFLATSYCQKFLKINQSFILFFYFILFHFLIGSFLCLHSLIHIGFPLITALFGSLSLVYSAYFIKPFTPAAVYTHAWVLGALGGGKFGAFCFGMAILGGYWPTLVYIAPALIIWHPILIFGILLAIPQLIPFLWYWPKSVRAGVKHDPNFGKVPLWRYLDLILPNRIQNTINGVFWPEMAMYCGLIPFLAISSMKLNGWLMLMVSSFFVRIQRIPARSLYIFSIGLIMLSLNSHITFPILFIQGWLLLENSNIYPHFPFCQWWDKPSSLDYSDISKWPGFTGYMTGTKTAGYVGGFSLRG